MRHRFEHSHDSRGPRRERSIRGATAAPASVAEESAAEGRRQVMAYNLNCWMLFNREEQSQREEFANWQTVAAQRGLVFHEGMVVSRERVGGAIARND